MGRSGIAPQHSAAGHCGLPWDSKAIKKAAKSSQNGNRKEAELPISPSVEAVGASSPFGFVGKLFSCYWREFVLLFFRTEDFLVFVSEIFPRRFLFVLVMLENVFTQWCSNRAGISSG